MVTPSWISLDLLQETLKSVLKNPDVKLVNFVTSDVVPAGENYSSDMFRTSLIYRNKDKEDTLSVIVKCRNEDGGIKEDFAKILNLFEKEIEMFTRIFPAIYEILGSSTVLSANCYYTSTFPHFVIIFEDLTHLGFEMLPRHIGFDLEHCFKVVEKIAQLHAASVIMYDKNPSLVKFCKEGLFADNGIIREWVRAGYEALIDACSRWPGFEKFGYKLSALGDEAVERGLKASRRKMGGFNVLNHGDLWVNNMMFSYDNKGKIRDMRFVDFQMNIFSSPAIDLHYFISTSTKIEVKRAYIDLILDHYYAQLLTTLTKLQYSLERVPTREQFRKDYSSRAFYGLMTAATVLPLVKASRRDDATFENSMKEGSQEGFRYHAFNNDRYRQHMQILFPYYDSFGILD